MKAPFPYFGGKSRAVDLVWHAFGAECLNYVEPFFGSGAMLLGAPKPHTRRTETVNDLSCYIANFWRAVRADPDAVARWAANPIIEVDFHARHGWLLNQKDGLKALMEHPDRFDAKIAGWWLWGACASIGDGWCAGDGAWRLDESGAIVKKEGGDGFYKNLPNIGAARGIFRLSGGGDRLAYVTRLMRELQSRLQGVRVTCGDWARVMGKSVTTENGLTAIFLDPPYERGDYQYDGGTDRNVAHDVRAWCIENGGSPLLRIALCGYDGDHDELLNHGWDKRYWMSKKGYAIKSELWKGEAIWFSPHCHKAAGLF